MEAEVTKEHQWLHQLLGDWTMEGECVVGPDQPAIKSTGAETVHSLGGVWVLCDGNGETPGGGGMKSLMTLGYDPAKKRFVGTFVASCMTHQWVYEGGLDESGKALTLDCKGPSFTKPGELADYKDTITIISPDHRTLTSQTQGDDGKWVQFMTAHYRRKA